MLTKDQYELVKKRVEKADVLLEDHWSDPDPKYQKWRDARELLVESMLEYEIENDLIPL